jgi:Uma2 family endonuclease
MKEETLIAYLQGPESMRPQELVYGMVREAPGPFYGHQEIVTVLAARLVTHVMERRLGVVCVAPIDVVLDAPRKLVVQPDVIFISESRRHIIKDVVWGAPDLAIEVLSSSTAARDRTVKVGWYQQYGVRECWLIDQQARTIEVLALAQGTDARRTFANDQYLVSAVLPDLVLQLADLYGS